jgi:hypothetical protein
MKRPSKEQSLKPSSLAGFVLGAWGFVLVATGRSSASHILKLARTPLLSVTVRLAGGEHGSTSTRGVSSMHLNIVSPVEHGMHLTSFLRAG